jgi:hypothetical protein
MGCNIFKRSSDAAWAARATSQRPDPRDPNPAVFMIKQIRQIRDFVVAMIHYPNCTNYGGDKILVWHGVTVADVRSRTLIDPHFIDGDETLVARFLPTVGGWEMAIEFAHDA